MALTRVFHHLAAVPYIYELSQRVAGSGPLDRLLRESAALAESGSVVVDVGGGSGRARSLWRTDCTYVVLDLDPRMLRMLNRQGRTGYPVLADATKLPLKDKSVDWVICKQVSHHVPDTQLHHLFAEVHRVLRRRGRFLFVDAVWRPDLRVSRWLWRHDRGSYPRAETALRELVGDRFYVAAIERCVNNHEYLLFSLEPK
jgi:ubiquinone/menaquinone biosynthesis C-methylase UbiE